MTKAKAKTTTRARPPKVELTADLLAAILDRVANGEALSTICDAAGMPSRVTFYQSVKDGPEIQAQYEFALQMRADKHAEDILDIADDGRRDTYIDADGNERTDQDVIARSRLRVDARKWLASKMAPKKYGDKLELAGGVTVKTITDMTDGDLAAIAAGSGN